MLYIVIFCSSVDTHKRAFSVITGGVTHNHVHTAGQRIVRSLIRGDFLYCQYRTGRFHCLILLISAAKILNVLISENYLWSFDLCKAIFYYICRTLILNVNIIE